MKFKRLIEKAYQPLILYLAKLSYKKKINVQSSLPG